MKVVRTKPMNLGRFPAETGPASRSMPGPGAFAPSAPTRQPAPAPLPTLVPARQPGAIPYALVLVYIGIIFSRILDVTVPGFRIPMMVFVLVALSLVFAGNTAVRLISDRTLFLMCCFTAWMAVTAATGVWRTGSRGTFIGAVMTLVLVFAIVCFTTSLERLRRTLVVIAGAAIVAALLSYLYGSQDSGRLELASGTFRDPNEYAMTIMLGIPLWLMVANTAKAIFWKVAAIGAILVILRTVLYTGSRGAMIAVLVLALMLFLRLPVRQKIALGFAVPLVVAAGYAMLPEYLKVRYTTLLTADVQTGDDRIREQVIAGDLASAESRLEMLKSSLRLTWENPLLGVGPGNFPTANFHLMEEEQHLKVWLQTHNSYTQVSSETGIPGFLLFACIIFLGLRHTRRVLRSSLGPKAPPLLLECARYLNLALITTLTGAIFLSIAYHPILYVQVALAVVLERLYSQHAASLNRGTAPAAPRAANPSAPQLPRVTNVYTPRTV